MMRYVAFALIAGVILAPTVHAQAPAAARTDALGDPLAPGAIARLGTLRFKHNVGSQLYGNFGGPYGFSTSLKATAFAPDGKTIASLDQNMGSLRVWDSVTGMQRPGSWSSKAYSFQAVAFAPEGATLAAVGFSTRDNVGQFVIIFWDTVTGKEVKTLLPAFGRNRELQALAFANGGKTLVAAGDGTVRWFDIAGEKVERSLNLQLPSPPPNTDPKIQTQSDFEYLLSPDAKSLVVRATFFQFDPEGSFDRATSEAVGFDLTTGRPRWSTSSKGTDQENMVIAFSADSKRVATAFGMSKIELRDAVTGKLVNSPFHDPLGARAGFLTALALTPDGGTLAMAGESGFINLWTPAVDSVAAPPDGEKNRTGSIRKLIGNFSQGQGGARTLAFSPDGKTLLVGAGNDLQIYNFATLKEVTPWVGHRSAVDYLAFSSDGQRLLSGSGQVNFRPEEVSTWDVATGKWLQMTSTRTPIWPNMGTCSPEHTFYVGKNGNDRFGVYNLENGKLIGRLSVSAKQNIKVGFFSPDSKYYVLASRDEQNKDVTRVFGIPSCKLLCQLPALPYTDPLESSRPIAFSANDGLVALFSRADGQVHIFEAATGKPHHRVGKGLEGNAQFMNRRLNFSTLAFSPDGKSLATWSFSDPVVRIWDMATGRQRLWLPPGNEQHFRMHLAWSPDGRMLAVGDHKIQLWELAAGKVRREFTGHEGDIRCFAFSPDGKLLASGSTDTTVLLWDIWGL